MDKKLILIHAHFGLPWKEAHGVAVHLPQPPFRVPPRPAGIEAELGIAQDMEEGAERLTVGTIRPGDYSALQFGYVISVDRHIAARLSGHEPRYFFCHLAFCYTCGQASATETVVNGGPLVQFSSLRLVPVP